MDTPSVIPLHQCIKCGNEYPLTPEFWQRNTEMRTGFRNECVYCTRAYKNQLRELNREKYRQHQRNYKARNADKVKAGRQKYREANRDLLRAKNRAYYAANKEKKKAYFSQYRQANKERMKIRDQQYRQRTKDHTAKYRREYIKRKPEVNKAILHRRLARKRSLPNTLTAAEWASCLEYWGHKCAVCGTPDDMFTTLAMDHWIPLNDPHPNNPGTVVGNVVPLCHNTHGLKISCNPSKGYSDPVEWLTRTLGKQKARRKLAEIQAYFSSVAKQNDE